MNTNTNNASKGMKSALKVISVVLICIFFLPTMTVSCGTSDSEIYKMSVKDLTFGTTIFGQPVDATVWPIILLLLPIASLIILFVMKKKSANIINACLMIVDLIIWIILINALDASCKENGLISGTTGWFTLNIILLIAAIAVSGILGFTKDPVVVPDPALMQPNMQMQPNIPIQNAAPAGDVFCPNCGNKLTNGSKFCDKCGTQL